MHTYLWCWVKIKKFPKGMLTSLNAYKEMGFTKETIINALALLGWSTENEIFR